METSFKTNLREELNFQNMTVKELSAKTGIPKPTLDCYLSARQTIPPADIAVKIASVLNVSVEFLVTGKENNEKQISTEETKLITRQIENLDEIDKNSIKSLINSMQKRYS